MSFRRAWMVVNLAEHNPNAHTHSSLGVHSQNSEYKATPDSKCKDRSQAKRSVNADPFICFFQVYPINTSKTLFHSLLAETESPKNAVGYTKSCYSFLFRLFKRLLTCFTEAVRSVRRPEAGFPLPSHLFRSSTSEIIWSRRCGSMSRQGRVLE